MIELFAILAAAAAGVVGQAWRTSRKTGDSVAVILLNGGPQPKVPK